MNRRSIAFAVALCGLFARPTAANGASLVVIGPGPQSLLYVTQDVDYHILDGTEIVSPSQTGPPDNSVVVTDAIEFRGGGHIRIDGGYFRGGDASYTANNGEVATVAAGASLHLRQSSGEVYAGTFIGGEATSMSQRGGTRGGGGLVLAESYIAIYGGYFEGGISTEPVLFGSGNVSVQEPAITAYSGSTIFMYGGHTNGDIELLPGATLNVYGADLLYDGSTLSGRYINGDSFSHSVSQLGGVVSLHFVVPEPSGGAITLGAMCAMFWRSRPHPRRRAAGVAA